MPYATLAIIQPMDPATGSRVSVYVSNINDRVNGPLVNGLNGNLWEPAIVQAPSLSITVWNGDFQAAVSLGSAVLGINMEVVKKTFPSADSYYWETAPVDIYAEQPGTAWPWTKRFSGLVTGYARKSQVLTLTAEVNSKPFEAKVLNLTYAGTGSAEGDANLKGKLKPLVLGWATNVEPVLIDTVNSVYQFSGYGAIEAVQYLYERGSDFGAATANYTTYANLVAATIAPGKWATCLAEGMVRLGAPAYGVITGDIKGHKVGSNTPRLTGAILNAMATIAGVSSALISTSSLTALDSAVPYNANIVLTEQETMLSITQRMALPCNWQAGINLTGILFVSQISLGGSPVLSLNAAGKTFPQVKASDELDVTVPYQKTILGANRSWRVHTPDEIAFQATLVDKGLYSGSTTYREGNIVTLSDGSRYLYTNQTATSGNTPPNATYWGALQGGPVVDWTAQITGTGKPADNATVGAPTGTPVGSITAADVSGTINSGGGVASSQVSTAAIVANAVSGINYAYTYAGTSPATSTWTTVQTVTLTTTGSAVMVKSSMNYTDVDSSSFTAKFRIRRNGTDISGEISIYPVPAYDGFSTWYYANLAGSFCIADTPSAGSNTYTLEVFSGNAPNVSSRYLEVMELKR